MFNSVVLDVFIGLVLIYLLYSLFITIIGEMVATWMAIRSRVLRVAIEKMLNDGYHKKHLIKKNLVSRTWNFIQQYFLKEFDDFKYSFAGKFYAHPSIKYLSDKGGEVKTAISQTKPSYISAEMFAATLVQLLKDKGNGATDMDRINFCLRFNTYHIEPSTLKSLRDLADNSGADVNALNLKFRSWYNETMDRANGWYKRKMQLLLFWLGFIVALMFNVDTIQLAKRLSKDKDARAQLVSMGTELAKDSARYKGLLANGDTLQAKQILDSGYAQVTKDMQDANTALGLGWPFAGYTNAVSASFEKSGNPAVFNLLQFYAPAINFFNDSVHALQYSLAQHRIQTSLFNASLETFETDTTIYKAQQQTDSLQKIIKQIDSVSRQKTILAAIIKSDSNKLLSLSKSRAEVIRILNSTGSFNTAQVDSIVFTVPNKTITAYFHTKFSSLQTTGYIISRFNPVSGHFWRFIFSLQFLGLVMTALMLSLGAPFWFDLLKKLVAIRGAGVKPEEKKRNETQTIDNSARVQQQLPVQHINLSRIDETELASNNNAGTALYNLTQKTKAEPGIIAVALQPGTSANTTVLTVFAENDQSLTYLKTKYGVTETLYNGFTIPIQYIADKPIKVHAGMAGAEIFNQNDALRTGTLGCHLQKDDSVNTYFISCWHVMKDDTNWHGSLRETTIVQETAALGRVEDGFLSHDTETGVDVGIARYNNDTDAMSNPGFIITAQHRAVTEFDAVVRTKVKLFGKVCQFREAEIFLHEVNAHIKYPDGNMHLMNDVFSITIKDPVTGDKKAPSSEGDSGAIVTDVNGVPLGMIIGGSSHYSYAMKFSNIFTRTGPLKEYRFKINF